MITASSPPVQRLITRFETKTNLSFRPRKAFFSAIQINAHRFALFTKGQKRPDAEEIKKLVAFFGQFFPVKAEDLLS
ncbi:hypothetical protein [Spirosoma koreense]